jgi:exodeoxyribonuclease V gamma subunit
MLEALLSARRTLYVSWSGRSVRNNSEQPPSVLVSQLRDEIDALWGQGSANRLTTLHPLQPFSRAYFEEGSALKTYAREWRAAQVTEPVADVTTQPHPCERMLPPLDAANGVPLITLAQLLNFLRRPVASFFSQRLQLSLAHDRTELHDEELFSLNGLDLYERMDQALQRLPADLCAEAVPRHVQAAVQRLRLAGDLPMAAVGEHEARRLTQALQPLLVCGLQERAQWPELAGRALIDHLHAGVRLQDALAGLRQRVEGDRLHTAWVEMRASKIATINARNEARALPDKLIGPWLTSLAAAVMGLPLHGVLVGRNAIVRIQPIGLEAARQQLDVLLAVYAEGMRWPLPLPPLVALQWLKHKDKGIDSLNALSDLYEGNGYEQEGEARKDAALYRTYPTLDDLLAGDHLGRLAEAVYRPLKQWAEGLQAEALADAEPDDETEGAS